MAKADRRWKQAVKRPWLGSNLLRGNLFKRFGFKVRVRYRERERNWRGAGNGLPNPSGSCKETWAWRNLWAGNGFAVSATPPEQRNRAGIEKGQSYWQRGAGKELPKGKAAGSLCGGLRSVKWLQGHIQGTGLQDKNCCSTPGSGLPEQAGGC